MDPLTSATTFASLVGLIGQFRSERSSLSQNDFNEFLEWLVKVQHESLKGLLETNVKATIGIKAILNEDRDAVLSKLESINSALSSFASGIPGFSEVVEAINPSTLLSKQAISLLCQFEDSQGSKLLETHHLGGMSLHLLDGNEGQINVNEPRFIEDDLRTLVKLGLLALNYNSKGENLYKYTRAASDLVQSFEKDS
jgi:hypothetical protein